MFMLSMQLMIHFIETQYKFQNYVKLHKFTALERVLMTVNNTNGDRPELLLL